MTNKMKIKKGDEVVVLTGRDKGKKGAIIKVIPDANRVVVAGINMVTEHVKPSMKSAGGLVRKEASIHASNVAIADPKSGKPSRVGYKIAKDGKKTRIAKSSGEMING